jgi:hypothetical protein
MALFGFFCLQPQRQHVSSELLPLWVSPGARTRVYGIYDKPLYLVVVFFLANWGKIPKNIIALLLAKNLAKNFTNIAPMCSVKGLVQASLLANFFL